MAKSSKVSKKAQKNKTKKASSQAVKLKSPVAFSGKDEAATLAKRIWLAGVGAYVAADQGESVADLAVLVDAGKTGEKALLKQLGKKKGRARIADVLSGQGAKAPVTQADRFDEAAAAIAETEAAQREKLEARMQHMRDMLGLQNFESKPKRAQKLNSKLDALEEQVAALKASSDPIDRDVRARVERLGQEIADVVGDGRAATPSAKTVRTPGVDKRGRLSAPIGPEDDLTAIRGVGPALQQKLYQGGVFHYWQIAKLTDRQISDLEAELGFGARVSTGDWKGQAANLAAAN